jgi:hypothetical protein
VGVKNRYPITAGILRHVEVADHLHLDGLALLSRWRLKCKVSHVIYCGFLICGSHDSAARHIGIHNEAVTIHHEPYLQLNSHAIVFLTNLEGWCGRSLPELWLTVGQHFDRISVRRYGRFGDRRWRDRDRRTIVGGPWRTLLTATTREQREDCNAADRCTQRGA